MSSAPPSIAWFFMNMAYCICTIIGSLTAQNACNITVTGTRNRTSSHAPMRARYPSATLSPPTIAIMPDSGTATFAIGTPALAA